MRGLVLAGIAAIATVAFLFGGLTTARAEDLRAPSGGTVRALIIGVNNYPRLGESAQLHGATADARDIAAALAKDDVTAEVILDGEATRARIIEAMNALVNAAKAGDFVLVAYAGHGMQAPEYARWKGIERSGVNEQIALSNFSFSGPGAGEIIVNVEIRAWLSRLDAKGVDTLLVMDSCFGGGMRGVDRRSGEIRVRLLPGSASEADRERFVGIPMTEKEARADIAAMTHVTFLGGATSNSVVPEMPGLDPAVPRGALSYFVARALEGGATGNGVVTRKSLFKFVAQNVSQATNLRQFVDVQPRSADPGIIEKSVLAFRAGAIASEATPVPSPAEPGNDEASDPVRLAIVDGAPNAWATIDKGSAPLVAAQDPSSADLVWDVGRNEALGSGDLVMESVDGSMIGAIADRTWAVRRLRALSQSRVLSIRLASGGSVLTSGDAARVEADDLRGEHLTTFNIAADGAVQMLFPAAPDEKGHCPDLLSDRWSCDLAVRPPFGADTIVALATSSDPADFVAWLKTHHGKRDAALLPAALGRLVETDPSARLGFAGVFTNSTRQ